MGTGGGAVAVSFKVGISAGAGMTNGVEGGATTFGVARKVTGRVAAVVGGATMGGGCGANSSGAAIFGADGMTGGLGRAAAFAVAGAAAAAGDDVAVGAGAAGSGRSKNSRMEMT